MRGAASCNLSERVLEVPLGPGGQARSYARNELMHARVSPHVQHLLKALDEVSPRALECAEEFASTRWLARLHLTWRYCETARRRSVDAAWPKGVSGPRPCAS